MTRNLPPHVETDVPLAPLTTIGVGGTAEYFARCYTSEHLTSALAFAAERALAVTVLGGGSNVVIADDGVPGLVLQLATSSIEEEAHDAAVSFHVAAGVPWDELVAMTVARGFGGIECLSGIPGLVGAAPMQNIGAYGQEVSTVIEAVWCVNRETGDTERFDADACGFGYRTSHFKTTWRDRFIVTRVDFRLAPAAHGDTSYSGVAGALGEAEPTLANVRNAVIAVRRSKSMVIDPADPNARSCGSFFTNPIVSVGEADRVARAAVPDVVPTYPAGDAVKIPAAWLIEHAGFERGHREGAVGLSTRHTLAIVNRGDARARDVADFARRVRDVVRQRWGVTLVPEPVFVGHAFDDD